MYKSRQGKAQNHGRKGTKTGKERIEDRQVNVIRQPGKVWHKGRQTKTQSRQIKIKTQRKPKISTRARKELYKGSQGMVQ